VSKDISHYVCGYQFKFNMWDFGPTSQSSGVFSQACRVGVRSALLGRR
jgi:hypothetical protein